MLADLRALRAVQDAQEAALRDGDPERVERLCADAGALLERLAAARPAPADEPRARALAGEALAAQRRLQHRAAAARAALLERLRALDPGRRALAGYRPPARDTARLVDRAR